MLLSHPWEGCSLSLIVERMTPPIDNSFLPFLLNWWIDGFDYLSDSNKFGTLCPTTVTNVKTVAFAEAICRRGDS